MLFNPFARVYPGGRGPFYQVLAERSGASKTENRSLTPFPILIWQLKKAELPGLDVHGKNATNWMISALISAVVGFILTRAIIGGPLLIVLGVLGVVFPIIAAINANNGVVWQYPLTIQVLK